MQQKVHFKVIVKLSLNIFKPGNNHNYCNTTMREPTTEIISRWYPVGPIE